MSNWEPIESNIEEDLKVFFALMRRQHEAAGLPMSSHMEGMVERMESGITERILGEPTQ